VLASELEALGAETILIPTIEIAPPASYCALDAALVTMRSYDWLIVTSPNAVQALVARGRQLGLGYQPRRVAAIGNSTARAVVESGLAAGVDLVPVVATGESLAEALAPHAAGTSMLLVRAAVGRDVLPEALVAAGAMLTVAEGYRNVVPGDSVVALRDLFENAPPDAITFTSASTAQNLILLLESASLTVPGTTVLASIGPITSAAMAGLGLRATVEAKEATISGLVEALVGVLGVALA
jgi:uroporphyrinogen-III synthase